MYKRQALRYAAYLTETLGGETYALKMADVVVNPNPLLVEQAKVKVYHPYLRWIDASGKEIEDLSYEDEYETVLYQKPTDSSFFQADPIVLKEWEASPALQTGEIGTVRFSIESRSLFFGSTFKMISMPSAQTSLTLRRSWITESEGIRRIDRTTHYEYDFLPESAATYTLTIEPFAYTVTRTGETRVFQTDPLTIVVTQRLEDKPFTGILNPLKPLRENSARVKNKQEFEKGLLYALEENWEEATRVFSRLAEEEPLSDDIWYNLGWVAFSSDQVGLSQLCFYRAFTIVETEDTQYNIRFIETAKGLSGRPLAKVKRIDGLAHRWLGVGGVVCLALFSFSITLRLRRLSVFKRRREAEHPEKHRRLSRALLAFIALICLAFCAANLRREYAFERQAGKRHDLERAVLVVGLEDARQREQRGEQQGDPEHAGCNAREQVEIGPQPQWQHGHDHEIEAERGAQCAAFAQVERDVAAQQQRADAGNWAVNTCSWPCARYATLTKTKSAGLRRQPRSL